MRYRWDKKYLMWGITAFLVIASCILLFFAIFDLDNILKLLEKIINTLMPIIYGLVFAYLLNPIMVFFEDKFFNKIFKKSSSKKKFSKILSIIVTYILVFLCLTALLGMIIPQLIVSAEGLVGNFPNYMSNFRLWLINQSENNKYINGTFYSVIDQINQYIENEIYADIMPKMNVVITNFTSGIYTVLVVFKNIIIGIMVSIYVLNSKEKFKAESKKVLYGILRPETVNHILSTGNKCHVIFGGFISGKLLDSLIIGIITFIVLNIIHMPFTLLISVVIGVTNIIPFFGPFIGAIPCAIIILLVNPIQCIYFVIFIIILQQIDGNIIGPKILGDSTGLSAFWVIVSILVGGGLFGFVGMLVSVPTFAVFYIIIKELIERKLIKKKLPINTEDYYNIGQIQPKAQKESKE